MESFGGGEVWAKGSVKARGGVGSNRKKSGRKKPTEKKSPRRKWGNWIEEKKKNCFLWRSTNFDNGEEKKGKRKTMLEKKGCWGEPETSLGSGS